MDRRLLDAVFSLEFLSQARTRAAGGARRCGQDFPGPGPGLTPLSAPDTQSAFSTPTTSSGPWPRPGSTTHVERTFRSFLSPDLLILDDLGLHRLSAQQSADLYELIIGRHRVIQLHHHQQPGCGGVAQPLRRPHPREQRPGPTGQCQLPGRHRGGQLSGEIVAPPEALGWQWRGLTPRPKPDTTQFTTLPGWVNDSVNPWVNDAVNRHPCRGGRFERPGGDRN